MSQKLEDILGGKMHVIENTMSLYAKDVALLPANKLYDFQVDAETQRIMDKCHIYLIGIVPVINLLQLRERNGAVYFDFKIGNETFPECLTIEIPPGHTFIQEGETGKIVNENGRIVSPSMYSMMMELSHRVRPLEFKILYIGQAYGEDGNRSAIDRLKEHSTLQKIALQKKMPEGFRLELVLLGIENGSRVITEINPMASVQNEEVDEERIKNGAEKLYNTTEAERVSLYEAALIRYFQPEYNKQLKNSFPSTNLKILNDCYTKDFQAVVAEINFDEFLYEFSSDIISPGIYHFAFFDLHDENSRRSFFSDIRRLNDEKESNKVD